MPTEKPKPSGNAKAAPSKPKSSELGDDELRTVSGGMAARGGAVSTPPVCVSQT